jgi:hypothetical protein
MQFIVIHSTEGLISHGFAFSSSLSNFRSHRQVFSFFLSALNFWFFCFKTKELKRETQNVTLFFQKCKHNSLIINTSILNRVKLC